MKSFSTLQTLFTTLSTNTTTSNASLGAQLISDQHRYLIQKYFDNERTYSTTTIGAQTLTLTAVVASGDTSATLSSAWTGISCHQLVLFSNSQQRTMFFTQGSAAVYWQGALTSSATATITTIGVQSYPIPPQVSKIKNDTITIGQLVYTPAPVQSIQEWTRLNSLPYTSDIPNYFYIYDNEVNFWPIPSTTGNLITFNYKGRVPELSFADYSTGTLSGITVGSNAITGVSTSWNATGTYPLNKDITYFNLFLKVSPPNGEGIWYPIERFLSDTSLLLAAPIQQAPSATASSYTIGQLPLLSEDFHDMLVYGALTTYFASINKDPDKYKMFDGLYQSRLELLEQYAGTKSVQVDLGEQPIQSNPNIYIFAS